MIYFAIISWSVAIILATLEGIIYAHWLKKNEKNFVNPSIDAKFYDEGIDKQLTKAVKYFKIVNN